MGVFPERLRPDPDGLVLIGGDFSRATITEAYTRGIFPWRGGAAIPWYCPDPRAVLRPGTLRVAHSLARTARREPGLAIEVDRDFRGAMERCATTRRRGQSGTWITPDMIAAYCELHAAGIAHSVEIYRDGEPIGGLYGLAFGRVFHGESMYHRERDASKLALWALDQILAARGFTLLDCQVPTPHLRSLGVESWPRARYLAHLADNAAASTAPGRWSYGNASDFSTSG